MNEEMNAITMSPEPATAPVKEPETKPAEPTTNPGKDDDPWKVPAPSVNPTPKA